MRNTRCFEPKTQCKACLAYWDAGIVYCTCGHFLRDDTTENKKYFKSFLDLLHSELLHQERPTPRPPLREERRRSRVLHRELAQEEMQEERDLLGIHERFIRDERFRKTIIELGRTEELCREMDKLANEDHTHHATEEISVYRNNWWIRSNFVGSDTMPIRHRSCFKEALSTLRRLKNAEDQAYYQNWWQSSSSSWWQWQDSWWHPSSETSPRRWT